MISLTMFSCDHRWHRSILTDHNTLCVVTVRSISWDWVATQSHDSGQRCESCPDRVSSVSAGKEGSFYLYSPSTGWKKDHLYLSSCCSLQTESQTLLFWTTGFFAGSLLTLLHAIVSERKSWYWTVTLFTMRKCFLSVTVVFIVSEVMISLMLHVSHALMSKVQCLATPTFDTSD